MKKIFILTSILAVIMLCHSNLSAQNNPKSEKVPGYKTIPSSSFLTINAEYLGGYRPDQFFNPQVPAFGFKAGTMRNVGWYVSALTNFNFKGTFVTCEPEEIIDDVTSSSYFEALGGITLRYWRPLSFHLGVGYFYRSFNNMTLYGQWAHVPNHIAQGPITSAGFMFHLGGFVVSAELVGGYNLHGLKSTEYRVDKTRLIFGAKAGLGICIPYRYRNEFEPRPVRSAYIPTTVVHEPQPAPTVAQEAQPTAPVKSRTASPVVTLPITQLGTDWIAVCGQVNDDFEETVTERGVCWSKSPYPSVNDARTSDGSGKGYFTTVINGLQSNATYYFCAYVRTYNGILYGNTVSMTLPAALPTQTAPTYQQPNYQQPVYPQPMYQQPVYPQPMYPQPMYPQPVYQQPAYPQPAPQQHLYQQPQQQPMQPEQPMSQQPAPPQPMPQQPMPQQPMPQQPAPQQPVPQAVPLPVAPTQPVGENNAPQAPECPTTVNDVDGNQYGTVQIGAQCWMKENLRTTHFADGSAITLSDTTSYDTPYCYFPNNDSTTVSTYGFLYNWAAAANRSTALYALNNTVQGICPNGWHLPSEAEWTTLTNYVSSQPACVCGTGAQNIAKSLASTSGWTPVLLNGAVCSVGQSQGNNNTSGFGALPAGEFRNKASNFGSSACFWSATPSSNGIYTRFLYGESEQVSAYSDEPGASGFSVRCLKS